MLERKLCSRGVVERTRQLAVAVKACVVRDGAALRCVIEDSSPAVLTADTQ